MNGENIEPKMNSSNNQQLSATGRIQSLDMLRGLMLVIITLNHLGGPIKKFTFQPLGFVSAAEGFIYLSGFVYGLVYTRAYVNQGPASLLHKSLKRAGVIYLYHVLVLLLVSLPIILNIHYFTEISNFVEQPAKTVVLFLAFLVQPQNMDILPLYVILILIGPTVIKAFHNGKVALVFIISSALWFFGQDKLFQYNDFDFSKYGVEPGNFNILCWQFLFISGIYFGYLKATARLNFQTNTKTILALIVALCVFMLARHSNENAMFYSIFSHFSERSSLGILRLLNFFIIAYLIYVLTQKKGALFHSKWLSLLGRNSLQVFASSVVLVYFFSIFQPNLKSYGIWVETVVDFMLVGSLTIPAWLHQLSVKHFPIVKS